MQRLRDAVRLAWVVSTGVVSRRALRPLENEARRPLPGDELVSGAGLRWTHGITIGVRPSEIWPWLVQMGCRRAGWYSYDGLDNGGVPSAGRIVPELQRAAVGDIFPMTPRAEDGFVVRAVEPHWALVLGTPPRRPRGHWCLEPIDDSTTRLVSRVRARFDRFILGLLFALLWRPIHFEMQRRQLLNLRRCVEKVRRRQSWPNRRLVAAETGLHGPDAGGCQAVLFEVRALTPSQHHGYPRLRGAPHTPAMSTMRLPPTFSQPPIRCLARDPAAPASAKAPTTSWWSPFTGRSTRLRCAPACAGSSVHARTRRRRPAAAAPRPGAGDGAERHAARPMVRAQA